MRIAEIIAFQASDAFFSDPQAFINPALGAIPKSIGFLGAFWGIQTEDGRSVYIALGWQTVEAHLSFRTNKQYTTVLAELAAGVPGGDLEAIETLHVDFSIDDLSDVLNAEGSTQIAICKLKEGRKLERESAVKTREDVRSSQLSKIVDGLLGGEGSKVDSEDGERGYPHPPSTFGTGKVDIPRVCYFALGWGGGKAQVAAGRADARQQRKGLPKFDDIAELSIVNVAFKKCAV